MTNYYKYLPIAIEDEDWGLYILNVGCSRILPARNYPIEIHPIQYLLNWKKGRILNEYQIIYVTNGEGEFESENCKLRKIEAGTIIILFPGERHRYRPFAKTGWDEYWFGVKGDIVDNIVKNGFLNSKNPCIEVGFDNNLLKLLNFIIEETKKEEYGYQLLISSAAFHFIGTFIAINKRNKIDNSAQSIVIDKAKLLLRSNLMNNYSLNMAAEELHVSYSLFRKLFKKYTGMSPGQYFILLKIEKAKKMLTETSISVKEIAYQLNFSSEFHFSKLFKSKTNTSPSAFRKRTSCDFDNFQIEM